MAKYSKAHERDESSKMGRGFWHSTFGILLCWVPGLGLLLSISGFCRQAVRLTEKHRVRWLLLLLYGLISLCVSIGAILGGLYAYSRDQQVFVKYATQGWHALTGQTALPGQLPVNDYTGNPNPGLGVNTDDSAIDIPLTAEDEALAPEGDAALTDGIDMASMGEGGLEAETDAEGAVIEESADDEGMEEDEVPLDEEEDVDDLLGEDYVPLDFLYSIEEDAEAPAENGLSRVDYKVIISKYDPTDEDLINMFNEAIYEDGYDLHSMSVYREKDSIAGEYTLARLVEAQPGEKPAIERKS